MDNDDPCWIGIADTGVSIKKSKIGIFGRKIYEKGPLINQYVIAEKLNEEFPKDLTPNDIVHPILKAFTNAALHCSSLEELEEKLRKFKWKKEEVMDFKEIIKFSTEDYKTEYSTLILV